MTALLRRDVLAVVRRSNGTVRFRTGRRKIAFGWYGGKFSHLDWLLPLLPFGGSAAVLLNREPARIETYNDLDGEVVNFFRVLREKKDRLIEAIGLTPFSREEFFIACEPPKSPISSLERAQEIFRSGYASTDWFSSDSIAWSLG